MHSRRKFVYYAIVFASLLWITGTVIFLFFQDIEVTVQVKRRAGQSQEFSPLSKPELGQRKFGAQRENSIVPVAIPQIESEDSNHNKIGSKNSASNRDELSTFITANYERTTPSRDPKAPGELGRGASAKLEEKEKEKEGYSRHAFNQLVSDKISVHRSLKDYRHERSVLLAFLWLTLIFF